MAWPKQKVREIYVGMHEYQVTFSIKLIKKLCVVQQSEVMIRHITMYGVHKHIFDKFNIDERDRALVQKCKKNANLEALYLYL